MRIFLFVIAILCGAASTNGQKNQFFFAQPPLFQYQLTQTTVIKQEIMGTPQQMTQNKTINYLFKTDSIAQNTLFLNVQLKRIRLQNNAQSNWYKNTYYDTNNPPDTLDNNFQVLQALTNKPFQIEITPNGKLLEIFQTQQLIDNLQQQVTNENNTFDALTDIISAEHNALEWLFNAFFSEHKQWTSSTSVDLIKTEDIFLLWEKNEANPLKISAKARREISNYQTTTNNIESVFDMAGKTEAEYFLAPNKNIPHLINILEYISGTVSMDLSTQGLQKLQWPIEIERKTSWKIIP